MFCLFVNESTTLANFSKTDNIKMIVSINGQDDLNDTDINIIHDEKHILELTQLFLKTITEILKIT